MNLTFSSWLVCSVERSSVLEIWSGQNILHILLRQVLWKEESLFISPFTTFQHSWTIWSTNFTLLLFTVSDVGEQAKCMSCFDSLDVISIFAPLSYYTPKICELFNKLYFFPSVTKVWVCLITDVHIISLLIFKIYGIFPIHWFEL